MTTPPARRHITPRRAVAGMIAAATVAAALLAAEHHAARPNLAGFEPAAMGRIEASMWRHYYEHRWLALGCTVVEAACSQYGLSWWDGARVAAEAVRAAAAFRASKDDPACLPALTRYYNVVRRAAPASFSPAEAAALELRWWAQRREEAPPADYAVTIARLTAMLYGLDLEATLPSARLRVDAMEYRDARDGGGMTARDWGVVEEQLVAAYSDLKRRLAAVPLAGAASAP